MIGKCNVCGEKKVFARVLGVCYDCITNRFEECMPFIERAHEKARRKFGLPIFPPRTEGGIPCRICSNNCVMGEGETGFCGLRYVEDGELKSLVSSRLGLLYAYLDPHVTNCCSAFFCPAGTGAGYPRYAYKKGPEYGYYNLAIFFYGCNFDCLFCQNYSHKNLLEGDTVDAESLVNVTLSNEFISCWCFFGGSPEPQLPFALHASRKVLRDKGEKRILRICFEWNGCGNQFLVRQAAKISLESGGNIKFDLKTFSRELSIALSGVSNEKAYRNFEMIAEEFYDQRPELPVLTATTLLVPAYVNRFEVERIAKFISELNENIPYSLLVFYPTHEMHDMTVTPFKQVVECYLVAKRYLKTVHVGNLHLIGFRDMNAFLKAVDKVKIKGLN
ncbi:radical SAM protein [archaeon]|nr:MAG: radical SAM protein [archaeon]